MPLANLYIALPAPSRYKGKGRGKGRKGLGIVGRVKKGREGQGVKEGSDEKGKKGKGEGGSG